MTDRIGTFQLTIPAQGAPNTIFFVDCELGDSNVTRIILQFPPGCAGNVGVRLEQGGSQVYPYTIGQFFIFDDYTLEIDPTDKGTSGQWHLAGYNTDQYPHTVTVHFFYDLVKFESPGQSTPLVSL